MLPVRYHRDGQLVTGAGVSASIDAGLFLAGIIGGEVMARTLQLGIEYYPDPPYGGSGPDAAPEEIKAMIKAYESSPAAAAMMRSRPPFSAAQHP